jgi:hypothetical protein
LPAAIIATLLLCGKSCGERAGEAATSVPLARLSKPPGCVRRRMSRICVRVEPEAYLFCHGLLKSALFDDLRLFDWTQFV